VALDVPLVVLVDGGTASASEIVAGALQDHERAVLIGEQTVLIGEQTFGKGTVQVGYGLSDGAELRITIAHWFTPDGRAIEKEGLTPDIVVEMTEADEEAGRDPQLARAIEYLRSQTSAGTDLRLRRGQTNAIGTNCGYQSQSPSRLPHRGEFRGGDRAHRLGDQIRTRRAGQYPG